MCLEKEKEEEEEEEEEENERYRICVTKHIFFFLFRLLLSFLTKDVSGVMINDSLFGLEETDRKLGR